MLLDYNGQRGKGNSSTNGAGAACQLRCDELGEPILAERQATALKNQHFRVQPMGPTSNQHPLYTWLTSNETNSEHGGRISWNFNKFVISRDGHVIGRFGSRTKPSDPKLVAKVEEALIMNPDTR